MSTEKKHKRRHPRYMIYVDKTIINLKELIIINPLLSMNDRYFELFLPTWGREEISQGTNAYDIVYDYLKYHGWKGKFSPQYI